jgi:hypothetical protein
MDYERYNQERYQLHLLVRTREDLQKLRISLDNRLGRKRDEDVTLNEYGEKTRIEQKNVIRRRFPEYNDLLKELADRIIKQEIMWEKLLVKQLFTVPIYTQFLINVKGVGPMSAGWLIAEFNIYKAETVSKMWQFAGCNPGYVQAQRIVKDRNGRSKLDAEGRIVREYTDGWVCGDKQTQGFVSPFNQRLRTALVGVLAKSFLMCKNDYALRYYYPYKTRLEQEENLINGKDIKWKDTTPLHRHRAALRFMIKAFLRDLYVKWRTLEGLSVREPYQAEYLGHQHGMGNVE